MTYEPFHKAVDRLADAIAQPKNEFIRDSVIQRFEFCVELAWKSAKKSMGSPSTAPKELIREMAQNNYIEDVDLWLKAIDKRNESSHTYNEDKAEEVYGFAVRFLPEAKRFSDHLKRKG